MSTSALASRPSRTSATAVAGSSSASACSARWPAKRVLLPGQLDRGCQLPPDVGVPSRSGDVTAQAQQLGEVELGEGDLQGLRWVRGQVAAHDLLDLVQAPELEQDLRHGAQPALAVRAVQTELHREVVALDEQCHRLVGIAGEPTVHRQGGADVDAPAGIGVRVRLPDGLAHQRRTALRMAEPAHAEPLAVLGLGLLPRGAARLGLLRRDPQHAHRRGVAVPGQQQPALHEHQPDADQARPDRDECEPFGQCERHRGQVLEEELSEGEPAEGFRTPFVGRPLLGHLTDRLRGQHDRAPVVPGVEGDGAGALEQVDPLQRALGGSGGLRVPQLEGAVVVPLCLGRRARSVRGGPRRHRGEQRLRLVAGLPPVDGERGRGRGVDRLAVDEPVLDGARERCVQADALPRHEVLVDGFGDQRVPERVHVGARLDDEHVAVDGDTQPLVQLGVCDGGELHDRAVVQPATRRGDHPQDLDAGVRQVRHPGQHQVAESLRQTLAGGDGEQLFGVQGVALRAGQHLADPRPVRLRAEDLLRHLQDLGPAERSQGERRAAAAAVGLGQEAPQRVPAMELVGPVRQHEQHPLRDVADEVRQDRARGPVRPVQVLDDEQDGRRLRRGRQQVADGLGQPVRATTPVGRPDCRGRCERGHQPGQRGPVRTHGERERLGVQLRDQPPYRLHHGRVGDEPVTDVEARTDADDEPPSLGLYGECAQQSGLADAGVPRHRVHRAVAARDAVERLLEVAALGRAAHEVRGGDACGHGRMIHHADPQRAKSRDAAATPGHDRAMPEGGAGSALARRPDRPRGRSGARRRPDGHGPAGGPAPTCGSSTLRTWRPPRGLLSPSRVDLRGSGPDREDVVSVRPEPSDGCPAVAGWAPEGPADRRMDV